MQYPRPESCFSLVLRGLLMRTAVVCCFFLVALASSALPAQAQTTGSPDLVISQIYTRGGEPGATFRNDFIEIFNRGNVRIDLTAYTLSLTALVPGGPPGSPPVVDAVAIRFVSSSGGIGIDPGQYVLYQFGSSGNNGALIPVTPDASNPDINLVSGSGRVALSKGNAALVKVGCPVGVDASLVDFFGYGTATCSEGGAAFSAPVVTNAAVRNNSGCDDTNNNVSDFTLTTPSPRSMASPVHVCGLPAPTSTVQFEVDHLDTAETPGSVEIFVTRTGDTSAPATVQYATNNTGTAAEQTDFTTALGTLRFAAGESRKSFRLIITDDAFTEGVTSFPLTLGYPVGSALGTQSVMTINIQSSDPAPAPPNPLDASGSFVRLHYADFLSRDPDSSGLAFWTNQIESCGADAQCREVHRINVSAAFYLSIEFQQTGFLVYRFYKASYPDSTSRPRSFPTYREFWHDTQDIGRGVVIGAPGADALLESNKALYASEFVTRPEFAARYPQSMTAAQFVDALNTNAGGALSASERDALVNGLQNGSETRATVLRKVAEDADFQSAEFNRAFVLTQYFGYLRRAPNDAPDNNFNGYDFWLGKLNQFGGNFINAEMVKAFITSGEYRHRFATQ
ncbi:MAG: DUF4214 domain-containing protein [Pyrinomonadaceae bacterium]